MRNWFQFGNIKFDIDDRLVIEKVPNQNRPARKMDVYNVPGRNGDIVVMQDAWENVSQTYEIWGGSGAINDATTFGYKCAELFKLSGYQELTDSYDTTHYRKAYFAGPFDVENEFTRRGRATLTFNCDPRRFLNSGKAWTTINASTTVTITNPTPYPAKPVLKCTVSNLYGPKYITVVHPDGTQDGLFMDVSDNYYVIDSENETIVDANGDPMFRSVRGDFPILMPGANTFVFSVMAGSCDLQPNWWTL